MGHARRGFVSLSELVPDTAVVRRNETTKEIHVADLAAGDILIVKPNERIAVDGFFVKEKCSVDEAPISGESLPVGKRLVDNFEEAVMNEHKLLIVGGVAGGASAAARARRLSEHAEIVVFERGPGVSFANCGLPYYIGNQIAERDKLPVTTPQRLLARFQLDVRTQTLVEAIDRSAKKVRVRDLASGREYDETCDKLILAPGAAPIRRPLPGIDLPGIFTLRNLQDVDHIKEWVDQGVKQAVLPGSGFICPNERTK